MAVQGVKHDGSINEDWVEVTVDGEGQQQQEMTTIVARQALMDGSNVRSEEMGAASAAGTEEKEEPKLPPGKDLEQAQEREVLATVNPEPNMCRAIFEACCSKVSASFSHCCERLRQVTRKG